MNFKQKKLLSFIALAGILGGCTPGSNVDTVSQAVDPSAYIVQSYPLDTKEYRYVELENGLRAILISDKDAVKAAASLNVDVGSYQDPDGWDGLAHFLEHMLFLGTEKYPDSDEYMKYLDAHGGQRNAYTAYDMTNYHFSVDANGFEGALDRFSQFFISPLFTEKYVDREKNAVHSEYFTRINNDGIRGAEVFENIINPQHPAFKFNAGNLDTLTDKPDQKAREVLIDFYNSYYSADHMTLSLVSNHSLDELEKLAKEKFSTIPVLNSVPKTNFPALFAEGELPKIVEIKPIQEARSLSLTFPMPVMREHYQENPIGFVASLISAEGENSLRDRLKEKGWILGFSASAGMSYGGNDSFTIGIGLTEAGEQHQDEIIAAIFDQIQLVRDSGVEEWRYNEIKNLAEMGFRFSENGSLGMQGAISFANALQRVLPRDLLGSGFRKFDRVLINQVLDQLRPENMVVTFSSPSVTPDKTTEFYEAEYRTYQPTEDRVASWSKTLFADLTLPERNPLIPENFDLEQVVSAEQPVKLTESGSVELWHYPNIEDGIPRTTVMLAIDRPDRPTLEQVFIQQFYFALMSEQLQDLGYNASRAGMSYSVSAGGVSFAGYSDKLAELSDVILAEVLKPRFTQQQFDRLVEGTERQVRNYYKVAPTAGVNRELQNLLNADSYPLEEQITVLRSITLEKVMAAPEWLYGESRMQMIAAGNITESQARDFADRIVKTLGIQGTDRAIPKGMRLVRVEENKNSPAVFVSELDHQDAAVLRYYQGRSNDQKEMVAMSFLGQMISQYYFNDLRTEQQLGYIVQAMPVQMDRTAGLGFMVQSPTADAKTVEAATDEFLPKFQQILENMTDEQFEPLKQATLAQLRQPAQSLGQKIGMYWQDLRLGYPEFNSRELSIEAVEKVTLSDIRDLYQKTILDNPRSLSVIAPGAKGGVTATVGTAQEYQEQKEIITRT
ncbi:insulinase family protein [Porticoccaceae bacterium LTM1]|nr:insulinase family protein [Porticoccaceae bacterium LTM1]